MKFEALHPDGRREILFSVPKYDFNWQYNPDPSKAIRWGEPSTEEMMDGWFEFILPATAGQTVAQADPQ
jgi:hypothetical protein